MREKRRVVITGLGVVSPIGNGKERFWDALVRGENGVKKIRSFDTRLYKTHYGGEVKDFKPEKYIRNIKVPSYCRSTQLAMVASRLAVEDSGMGKVLEEKAERERCGVIVGSTTQDPKLGERYVLIWAKRGYENTPVQLTKTLNWFTVGLANSIARELNISGLSMSIPAACAAGNYTIGYAFDLIKAGRLDTVLAGGTDPMNQLVYAGFNRLMAMAPQKCQPFDRNRKGLIVSEGAGVLVLEELEHARRRKAGIYAEVISYGLGCDAYHSTGLHPEGLGIINAVKMALGRAGLNITDIDYINAHGTGTPLNDRIETKVIKKIFGSRAKKIPISSIKSMIGHTMGAASAIEAVACSLIIRYGIIPATINYVTPDPECDLDYVPNRPRKQKVSIVLSNSFGFGGNIGVLVIGRFNG
ncbi:MAG: beta-ketoacyl-[acyl-carrier-protein] synthase family protein [Candidatus Omnitrophota bacterium]